MSDKQVVLNQRDPVWKAYNKRMVAIEQEHHTVGDSLGKYWWNIFEIHRDKLYPAGGFDSWDAWTRDFEKEMFGDSRSNVYNHIRAVKFYLEQGYKQDKVMEFLGNWNVAMGIELPQLADKEGKLKPYVEEILEAQETSPKKLINQMSKLSASEARTHLSNYIKVDHIYVGLGEADILHDPKTGILYLNVRHETTDDGLVGAWTLQIQATQTAPKKRSDGQRPVPPNIAAWLVKQLKK